MILWEGKCQETEGGLGNELILFLVRVLFVIRTHDCFQLMRKISGNLHWNIKMWQNLQKYMCISLGWGGREGF